MRGKPGVIISAFHFLPLIVHFKQGERGDRGENVGVITGLLFVNASAPAGMEEVCRKGSELDFSGWCSLVALYFFF